ncbi:hypothetical protein HMPREF9699_01303 [Bergeyella zoohelcum ATCC 43767]|uniref:Uncharacterized protein n=2 Tax=Bergeyella zoohelcum TaxID=1015 RepID=K1MKS4_9FLAO|nr:hypothetical protein HMPREF9699_01303 [Bergeyella zoohelcum ATCC 43767]SUV48518.1 Uncharacterised protein [Bergeyella zoohelcum]
MRKMFPAFSLHCSLMNIDIVGIWILKTGQVMTILYRQGEKIGFTYEMEGLTEDKQTRVYKDIPNRIEDLETWEEKLEGKVQVIRPRREHFVWVKDRQLGILREVRAGIKNIKTRKEWKKKKLKQISK